MQSEKLHWMNLLRYGILRWLRSDWNYWYLKIIFCSSVLCLTVIQSQTFVTQILQILKEYFRIKDYANCNNVAQTKQHRQKKTNFPNHMTSHPIRAWIPLTFHTSLRHFFELWRAPVPLWNVPKHNMELECCVKRKTSTKIMTSNSP